MNITDENLRQYWSAQEQGKFPNTWKTFLIGGNLLGLLGVGITSAEITGGDYSPRVIVSLGISACAAIISTYELDKDIGDVLKEAQNQVPEVPDS